MSLKDRLESTHSLTSALTDDANPVINYGACLAGNYTILRQEEDNSWLVVDPASLILIGYRLIEDQRALEYLWNGIRQIREDLSSIKRLARGEDR